MAPVMAMELLQDGIERLRYSIKTVNTIQPWARYLFHRLEVIYLFLLEGFVLYRSFIVC